MAGPPCTHIEATDDVRLPRAHECQECVKIGARWVHLRTRFIASAERGERWLYCYPDDAFAAY
jgi:hypothetical protein